MKTVLPRRAMHPKAIEATAFLKGRIGTREDFVEVLVAERRLDVWLARAMMSAGVVVSPPVMAWVGAGGLAWPAAESTVTLGVESRVVALAPTLHLRGWRVFVGPAATPNQPSPLPPQAASDGHRARP